MTDDPSPTFHTGTERFRIGPLRVADARVFVETSDQDFAAVLRWSFQDLAEQSGEVDPGVVHEFKVLQRTSPWTRWAMWRDQEVCGLAFEEGYVLFHLQWELNRIVLERRRVTVHSAAATIDGRGVMLVGASMSGKTTLAGHLATVGGGLFVADEIVSLSSDGSMLRYPRPLGLRQGGPLEAKFAHPDNVDRRFDSYEMLVPVSALGGQIATGSVEVDAIVFPKYVAGESTVVARLSQAETLERLCASSPGLARNGREVFQQLATLARGAICAEMVSSDLEHATQSLTALLG